LRWVARIECEGIYEEGCEWSVKKLISRGVKRVKVQGEQEVGDVVEVK